MVSRESGNVQNRVLEHFTGIVFPYSRLTTSKSSETGWLITWLAHESALHSQVLLFASIG